ncbi:hypothetical protein CRUP_026709, partial [Coryphaenoides rupestris]
IFFSFMLTPLFKKPKFASTVGSMLTVVFGCLSLFTVLMDDFPQPLVLPGELRLKRSPLYFLKPSYWSHRKKRYVEVSSVYEAEVNGAAPAGQQESAEAVSPDINDIRKVYKEKDDTVDALRGLTFDIYEGQITALLGHSGAGKSTLMNILCGISQPSSGTATIYGQPVAELADGPEMKRLVGVCPQFNIMFDVLTVEEHLRIFAAIKGIPPADVDGEVRRVLKDLLMHIHVEETASPKGRVRISPSPQASHKNVC